MGKRKTGQWSRKKQGSGHDFNDLSSMFSVCRVIVGAAAAERRLVLCTSPFYGVRLAELLNPSTPGPHVGFRAKNKLRPDHILGQEAVWSACATWSWSVGRGERRGRGFGGRVMHREHRAPSPHSHALLEAWSLFMLASSQKRQLDNNNNNNNNNEAELQVASCELVGWLCWTGIK